MYDNAAVQAATGHGPEEYAGKTNRDLAGDPNEEPGMAVVRQRWDEMLRRVFETGQPTTFEIEVPRPDGRRWYRWYESRMVAEDEESAGTVAAISQEPG